MQSAVDNKTTIRNDCPSLGGRCDVLFDRRTGEQLGLTGCPTEHERATRKSASNVVPFVAIIARVYA